jgi:alkanesulfonate monooxygenase SsuD/methylene tetrahydromethanopterin reductase-like flavin-dependent oxidoreductase (luciferase family)
MKFWQSIAFAESEQLADICICAEQLGIGAGWMKEEFDLTNQNFHDRSRRMDEMIEVMRLLWRGGMVEHHGKFFDFPPMQMAPAPTRPVPVVIGEHSAAALRRAARNDGWFGADAYQPELLLPILDQLRELPGHAPIYDRVEAGRYAAARRRTDGAVAGRVTG